MYSYAKNEASFNFSVYEAYPMVIKYGRVSFVFWLTWNINYKLGHVLVFNIMYYTVYLNKNCDAHFHRCYSFFSGFTII